MMTFSRSSRQRFDQPAMIVRVMLIALLAITFVGCESMSERRARYDRKRSAILHATQGSERHLDERYEALEELDNWFYKRKSSDY